MGHPRAAVPRLAGCPRPNGRVVRPAPAAHFAAHAPPVSPDKTPEPDVWVHRIRRAAPARSPLDGVVQRPAGGSPRPVVRRRSKDGRTRRAGRVRTTACCAERAVVPCGPAAVCRRGVPRASRRRRTPGDHRSAPGRSAVLRRREAHRVGRRCGRRPDTPAPHSALECPSRPALPSERVLPGAATVRRAPRVWSARASPRGSRHVRRDPRLGSTASHLAARWCRQPASRASLAPALAVRPMSRGSVPRARSCRPATIPGGRLSCRRRGSVRLRAGRRASPSQADRDTRMRSSSADPGSRHGRRCGGRSRDRSDGGG